MAHIERHMHFYSKTLLVRAAVLACATTVICVALAEHTILKRPLVTASIALLAIVAMTIGFQWLPIVKGRVVWSKQIVIDPLPGQVSLPICFNKKLVPDRIILLFAESTGLYRGTVTLRTDEGRFVLFELPARKEYSLRCLGLHNTELLRSPGDLVYEWKGGRLPLQGFELEFKLGKNVVEPSLRKMLTRQKVDVDRCVVGIVVKE